jgi:predicted nucleotidyltransferase
MNPSPLSLHEMKLIHQIFVRHPEITEVKLFGSRAKGTHLPSSDIDLAISGKIDDLKAEAISAELDELPLPYHFDVLAFDFIEHKPLRDHIERVGLPLYPLR